MNKFKYSREVYRPVIGGIEQEFVTLRCSRQGCKKVVWTHLVRKGYDENYIKTILFKSVPNTYARKDEKTGLYYCGINCYLMKS